jgi:putative toxin-antitoxin system antitoxin component (TIGR02293 family)
MISVMSDVLEWYSKFLGPSETLQQSHLRSPARPQLSLALKSYNQIGCKSFQVRHTMYTGISMLKAVEDDHHIARTYKVLGGENTIGRPVRTSLEAHELLLDGLPISTLLFFTKKVALLGAADTLEKTIGIRLRTLRRQHRKQDGAVLSVELSNKVWKFADILGQATEIFGTTTAAAEWLSNPATGLDQRKPIDLIATTVGLEMLEEYMARLKYGVYL